MRLNKIIRLYVPGTVDNRRNREEQEAYVDLALETFTDLFGGATAMEAKGAYRLESGVLVKEPIVLVYTFTDEEGLAKHRETVEEFAKRIAIEMVQECVSVEFEGELYFIYPEAKAA